MIQPIRPLIKASNWGNERSTVKDTSCCARAISILSSSCSSSNRRKSSKRTTFRTWPLVPKPAYKSLRKLLPNFWATAVRLASKAPTAASTAGFCTPWLAMVFAALSLEPISPSITELIRLSLWVSTTSTQDPIVGRLPLELDAPFFAFAILLICTQSLRLLFYLLIFQGIQAASPCRHSYAIASTSRVSLEYKYAKGQTAQPKK